MLKPIKLFSLLLLIPLLLFSEELQKELTVKVKVKDIIKVEKPPYIPPDKLSFRKREVILQNIIGKVLEPPKEIEEAELYVPKEGGCGAPKDVNLYKNAVEAYKKGNLFASEKYLKDLISIPNSPYTNAGKYILGLVYVKKGKKEEALKLFEEACNTAHMYTMPSCESFFALYFQLFEKPYPTEEPLLWKYVYMIRESGIIPKKEIQNCQRYTFKKYCAYVNDFIAGRPNLDYLISTKVRRAIKLFNWGRLEEAKKILLEFKDKLIPYRDVVLYYLALIALNEGKTKEALDYAVILETLNPELAKSVYLSLFLKDHSLADFVYRKTGEKWVLEYAGVKAYNGGNYRKALEYFEKAGKWKYAVYAALKLKDYEKAYEILKNVKDRDREYYRLLLEVLYSTDMEDEFLKTLEEIAGKYPKLYKEYYGWYLFKKGNWLEAEKYFDNPYYKAVAYFNAGDYEKVLELLKDDNSYEARVLKAKAAISLGKGELARKFLYNETPEEVYLTGLSYFIDGEYEKAIPYFEKLTQNEEYRLKALLKLADSYYNLGQKEKARAIYTLILSKYSQNPEAKEALLGVAQIEIEAPTKELEKIVKDFEEKYPNSPLLPELKLQLARIYAKEGRKVEAQFILRKLVNNPEYRDRASLLLADVVDNPSEKERILINLLKSKDKAVAEEAFAKLVTFYEERGNLLKLARLLEKRSDPEKVKAIQIYLKLGRIKEAERLFNRLIKKYPESEELKEVALKLYEKTKKRKYLFIAYKSAKPEVALSAAYYLGNEYKGEDDKKALEYFLEVVLSEKKDLPFYKRAVLESATLLKSFGAKKDASCILKRLEGLKLEKWEEERVLELKKGLPECGG